MHHVYRAYCIDCGQPFYCTAAEAAGRARWGLGLRQRCAEDQNAFLRDVMACRMQGPAPGGGSRLGCLAPPRPPEPIPSRGIDFNADPARPSALAGVMDRMVAEFTTPGGRRVAVLHAPTGTGKSTFAPYRLLRSPLGEQGVICVTQPRTITLRHEAHVTAETTLPGWVAASLAGQRYLTANGDAGPPLVGQGTEIGYRFMEDTTHWDRENRLLYVTDGTLLRNIVAGDLDRFSVLFIDEAHELTRNIDLILGLLRERLPLFPRLRLVIASATVELDRFVQFFGGQNSVMVARPPGTPATPFSIDIHWPEEGFAEQLQEEFDFSNLRAKDAPAAAAAVVYAIRSEPGFSRDPFGDILVFVPTGSLVDKTLKAVEDLGLEGMKALPCHAQMDSRERTGFAGAEAEAKRCMAAKLRPQFQRVIVATDYAETSVTIENLSCVIDSGYVFRRRWDPELRAYSKDTVDHSRQGILQRRGRVGRRRPGEFFPLYTRAVFESMQESSPADTSSSTLDGFLLSAAVAGVSDLNRFDWPGRTASSALPSEDQERHRRNLHLEIERSLEALRRQGAIDEEGLPTARGVELETTRTDNVDAANLLLLAARFGYAHEAVVFMVMSGAAGSVRRGIPFESDEAGRLSWFYLASRARDDLDMAVNLYTHWHGQPENRRERWASKMALDPEAMEKIHASCQAVLQDLLGSGFADRPLKIRALDGFRFLVAQSYGSQAFANDPASEGAYRAILDAADNRRIEIGAESVCVCDPQPAFVSFQLSKEKLHVSASSLVAIDPRWVTAAYHDQFASWLPAMQQLRRPRPAAAEIAIRPFEGRQGEIVENLRAVRRITTDGRSRIWLVRQDGTGAPGVLTVRGRTLVPGDRVRGELVARAERGQPAQLTQENLTRMIEPDQEFSAATLRDVRRSDAGEVDALVLQLEGGIDGLLRARNADSAMEPLFRAPLRGATMHVIADKVGDDGTVHLITPEIFRRRM